MQRIFLSFSKGILILLAIGIMLIAMNAKVFFVSIKPSTSFEDLLEKNPKAGMHVKGDVAYAYDCFAIEETWTERSDGSRTAAKKSHYYYSVLSAEGVFGLEVAADDYKAMEQLSDETYYFVMGVGEKPTTKVSVDGVMEKMGKDLKERFVSYLKENEFTDAEIEAMGDMLVVKQYSMMAVRVMFLIGAAFVLLAVFLFIRNYNGQEPKESTPVQPDDFNNTEQAEL